MKVLKCIGRLLGEREGLFFSTLKVITAIPLPRFERGPSRLPFAYSLYGVLFH